MFYEIKFTMPALKIKNSDGYKIRVKEILCWQMKDTVLSKASGFVALFQSRSFDDFMLSLFLIAWSVITIPFAIVYILLCFVELIAETVLFPLFLVPVIRILPIAVATIIWSLSFAIGVFSGAALQQY